MIINVIHLPEREDRLSLFQKEVKDQGLDVRYWPGIRDPLNRSFVGIAQAHKQIVSYSKKENTTCVCIAEDDVHFFAPGAWQYFLDNIPQDYDIYFGGVFWGELSEENTVVDLCGMSLYIVHERFYDTFLSLPDLNHIDRSLAGKGRYVVCDPMVVTQHGGYSDNKLRHDSYERYLVGKKLFGGVTFK